MLLLWLVSVTYDSDVWFDKHLLCRCDSSCVVYFVLYCIHSFQLWIIQPVLLEFTILLAVFLLPLAISFWRHSVVWEKGVEACMIIYWKSINRLCEFHQIYDFGAVGDVGELISLFEMKRSKVRVTARPNVLLRQRHTDWLWTVKDHLVDYLRHANDCSDSRNHHFCGTEKLKLQSHLNVRSNLNEDVECVLCVYVFVVFCELRQLLLVKCSAISHVIILCYCLISNCSLMKNSVVYVTF